MGKEKNYGWRRAGLGALAILAVILIVAAMNSQRLDSGQVQEAQAFNAAALAQASEQAAAETALSETIARCLGARTRDAATGCASEDLGEIVHPRRPADDAKAYCWTTTPAQPLDSCEYGSSAADAERVAVVGDSHARHLMPGLEAVADAEKWAIDSYFGNGCSLTVAPLEACATAGAGILPALTQGDPYDIVLVSVSRRKAVNDAAVTAAVHQVQVTGAKVVFMEDVPTMTPEAIACSTAAEHSVKTSRCGVPAAGMKVDLMVELGRKLDGVGIGIITPYFCDPDWCPSVIGNAHVFTDEGAHLTATYSRTLGPYLASAIKSAAKV